MSPHHDNLLLPNPHPPTKPEAKMEHSRQTGLTTLLSPAVRVKPNDSAAFRPPHSLAWAARLGSSLLTLCPYFPHVEWEKPYSCFRGLL